MKTTNSNMFDIFDIETTKARLIHFNEDPLAVALSHRRYRADGYTGFLRLQDDEKGEKVIREDREYAEQIYDYYKKKYFFQSLTDNHVTKFQKRLLEIISERPTEYQEKELGLFTKLPYFYEEDQIFDRFKYSKNIKTHMKYYIISDPLPYGHVKKKQNV